MRKVGRQTSDASWTKEFWQLTWSSARSASPKKRPCLVVGLQGATVASLCSEQIADVMPGKVAMVMTQPSPATCRTAAKRRSLGTGNLSYLAQLTTSRNARRAHTSRVKPASHQVVHPELVHNLHQREVWVPISCIRKPHLSDRMVDWVEVPPITMLNRKTAQ